MNNRKNQKQRVRCVECKKRVRVDRAVQTAQGPKCGACA